jgi:hypothetical protein
MNHELKRGGGGHKKVGDGNPPPNKNHQNTFS